MFMRERKGIPVEKAHNREILRKQMEMLAEDSTEQSGHQLAETSMAMVEIYKWLPHPFPMIFLIIFFHFVICFFIKFKKFNRGIFA